MTFELGCPVCHEGFSSGGEPTFVIATTPTDLLYRCRVCETWWVGDSHSLHPVTAAQAHERFPEQVSA
ncbi:hypothetical protein ACFM35_14480 [Microbacterium sp. P01]|uniref:hypothetical protein n=1 Tax=Microbacterium sp. P01 TaxID=3366261 RepID=UPI003672CB44